MPIDPVFLGLVVLLLGFVFFVYMFLRRTLLSFREGFEGGRK